LPRVIGIDSRYRQALADVPGVHFLPIADGRQVEWGLFPGADWSDYPLSRDQLYDEFRREHIFVRRYFYPLISDFPMYRGLASAAPANLPVATQHCQAGALSADIPRP
jgi:dTDP-4-amino-4,6-dideoxygalactose transaminase